MTMLARNIRLAFGTLTDKSSVTTGSFVKIVAANANRLGYLIENMSSTVLNPNGANLYVRLGDSGAEWEVLPAGYFPPAQLEGWTGDVYVKGAAGVTFAAAELT